MDLATITYSSGILMELLLTLVLLKVGAYRRHGVYFAYIVWTFCSDLPAFLLVRYASAQLYFKYYLVELAIDSVLMSAVMVELLWTLLLPVRGRLPRYGWVWLSLLILLASALAWPLAGLTVPPNVTSSGAVLVRIQQSVGILRVVICLSIAAFSQALRIGWRNRELQIATGFGIYAVVQLTIAVLHAHQRVNAQYYWLDLVGCWSYICVCVYWMIVFTLQEETRQEFTSEMNRVLLGLARVAAGTPRQSER